MKKVSKQSNIFVKVFILTKTQPFLIINVIADMFDLFAIPIIVGLFATGMLLLSVVTYLQHKQRNCEHLEFMYPQDADVSFLSHDACICKGCGKSLSEIND